MIIIDSHLDLAWNALQWNRDLQCSAHTIRVQEGHLTEGGRGQNTVALPDLRRGRVALCFATMLARATGHPSPHIDYASPAQAYGIARGQLAYYRALEEAGQVRIVSDRAGLEGHIAGWQSWDASAPPGADATPVLGFVISMEGADPILRPEHLPDWWQAGLRVLGITHYGTGRYAGGTGTELGVSELGKPLLAQMEQLGMLLDLSHLSDQAFWQALDSFHGRVLASHNNCRQLVPHQRQMDDRQLRAIFERDGVIGVAFDNWMLQPGWVPGKSDPRTVSLAQVVDHIDAICQLAGSSRHAAIGSDLDGGFGREQSPHDLDTIADLQKLAGLLAERGYQPPDIAAVMHGNWLRLLRAAWQ